MNILIGFECSGIVRDAFRRMGHEAWSCDIQECDPRGEFTDFHIVCDVRRVLPGGDRYAIEWDMGIFHPVCRFLSASGLHWNKRGRVVDGRPREEHTLEALAFVEKLWRCEIPRVVIENPIGCINSRLPFMPRPQIIQPHQFGDDASKATCLWLRGVDPLPIDPANRKDGRIVVDPRTGKTVERWSNQTDSGQNRLGPSDHRAALRATTYPGIARAMAEHWGAK